MSEREPCHLRTWFIFGETADGLVDVSDGESDVLILIPRELAERVIEARDHTVACHQAHARRGPQEGAS